MVGQPWSRRRYTEKARREKGEGRRAKGSAPGRPDQGLGAEGEGPGREMRLPEGMKGLGERAKEGDWAGCVQLRSEVSLSKAGKKLRSWELGRRRTPQQLRGRPCRNRVQR